MRNWLKNTNPVFETQFTFAQALTESAKLAIKDTKQNTYFVQYATKFFIPTHLQKLLLMKHN